MIPLLLLAQQVDPVRDAGWTLARETADCRYLRGPRPVDGVSQVRAVCRWSDVSYDQASAALIDLDAHDLIWGTVQSADVLGDQDGWTQVAHVHAIPGMPEREALLEWHVTHDDAAAELEWRLASVQPATERVPVGQSTGRYEVRPVDQGVVVVATYAYHPGGRVPDGPLQASQLASAQIMMAELRAYAQGL